MVELDDRWLLVEEVDQYLGVKRDTLYKWIEEKHMLAHKIGRLWKFQKIEIDTWMKSGSGDQSKKHLNSTDDSGQK